MKTFTIICGTVPFDTVEAENIREATFIAMDRYPQYRSEVWVREK